MKFLITLKSGVVVEVTSSDSTKSPVGLWIWSLRQLAPQVISFVECSVLASEIAVITPLEEAESW